jgi:hypothetical protein
LLAKMKKNLHYFVKMSCKSRYNTSYSVRENLPSPEITGLLRVRFFSVTWHNATIFFEHNLEDTEDNLIKGYGRDTTVLGFVGSSNYLVALPLSICRKVTSSFKPDNEREREKYSKFSFEYLPSHRCLESFWTSLKLSIWTVVGVLSRTWP